MKRFANLGISLLILVGISGPFALAEQKKATTIYHSVQDFETNGLAIWGIEKRNEYLANLMMTLITLPYKFRIRIKNRDQKNPATLFFDVKKGKMPTKLVNKNTIVFGSEIDLKTFAKDSVSNFIQFLGIASPKVVLRGTGKNGPIFTPDKKTLSKLIKKYGNWPSGLCKSKVLVAYKNWPKDISDEEIGYIALQGIFDLHDIEFDDRRVALKEADLIISESSKIEGYETKVNADQTQTTVTVGTKNRKGGKKGKKLYYKDYTRDLAAGILAAPSLDLKHLPDKGKFDHEYDASLAINFIRVMNIEGRKRLDECSKKE